MRSAPEAPPRSAATVERYRAAFKGAQRPALRMGTYALVFVWLFISVNFIIAAATATSPDSLGMRDSVVAIVGSGVMVISMAYAVSRLVARDIRNLVSLVRDGERHDARVMQDRRRGSLHVLAVAWDDDRGHHGARLQVELPTLQNRESLMIFALPGLSWIAADLGEDGVFLGRRR